MSKAVATTLGPDARIFRPHPVYILIPFAVGLVAIAATAWFAPLALLYTVPTIAVALAIVSLGNAGLIVTRDGIEWYALRPRWRFRAVPWDAVIDVRRSLFGRGNAIRLKVKPGRYEPWIWGTPHPDRPQTIVIHLIPLCDRDDLLTAIQAARWQHDPSVVSLDEAAAG
ncbi:MAG TPA: hypothetical protein VM529_10355 [Gemmata sp.]|nr:hypothetical protein [Gemmata sp.]